MKTKQVSFHGDFIKIMECYNKQCIRFNRVCFNNCEDIIDVTKCLKWIAKATNESAAITQKDFPLIWKSIYNTFEEVYTDTGIPDLIAELEQHGLKIVRAKV